MFVHSKKLLKKLVPLLLVIHSSGLSLRFGHHVTTDNKNDITMDLFHLQETPDFWYRCFNQYLVTGGYILSDSLPADHLLTRQVIVTVYCIPYPASSDWSV